MVKKSMKALRGRWIVILWEDAPPTIGLYLGKVSGDHSYWDPKLERVQAFWDFQQVVLVGELVKADSAVRAWVRKHPEHLLASIRATKK